MLGRQGEKSRQDKAGVGASSLASRGGLQGGCVLPPPRSLPRGQGLPSTLPSGPPGPSPFRTGTRLPGRSSVVTRGCRYRAILDWASASQAVPTTRTWRTTRVCSSQRSSQEERLPKTGGYGRSLLLQALPAAVASGRVSKEQLGAVVAPPASGVPLSDGWRSYNTLNLVIELISCSGFAQ